MRIVNERIVDILRLTRHLELAMLGYNIQATSPFQSAATRHPLDFLHPLSSDSEGRTTGRKY